MIRFLLDLVPPGARIGVLLAAVAALALGIVAFGAARYSAGHDAGQFQAEAKQAQVDAKRAADERAAQEQAAEDLRLKNRANAGVTDANRKQALADAVGRAHAVAERDRLLELVARLGAAASAPGAGPDAHGLAVAGGLLGECSSRYEAVAGDAATLRTQVIGLQGYVRKVCQPEEP